MKKVLIPAYFAMLLIAVSCDKKEQTVQESKLVSDETIDSINCEVNNVKVDTIQAVDQETVEVTK